ncbi:MAG: hypothetical protein ACJAYU_000176 [Bradymonadia bacterium]|jgi:hypothetical protein
MQYLLLLYTNEETNSKMFADEEAQRAYMGKWGEYSAALGAAGKLLGGEALRATSTATTVRLRDGKRLTTDGPFAETKEQLGGFYLIEADNLDEAIEWAAKIPSVGHGSVEVRPIISLKAGQTWEPGS